MSSLVPVLTQQRGVVRSQVAHTDAIRPGHVVTCASRARGRRDNGRHVCVVGGGVMGVTSAYFLATSGYRVTVVEENDGFAENTSYANAGVMRATVTHPLASSDSIISVVSSTWGRVRRWFEPELHTPISPFVVHASAFLDADFWRWGAIFVRSALWQHDTRARFMNMYGQFALHALRETVAHEGLAEACELREDGGYEVMEDEADARIEAAKPNRVALKPRELARRVPALAQYATAHVAGATFEPQDITGDCYKFTNALASVCRDKHGVRFRTGSKVVEFMKGEDGRVVAVKTADGGVVEADEFVVAVGPTVNRFMVNLLGVRVPVFPIRGYSLTVPVTPNPTATTLGEAEVANKLVVSHDSFVHQTRFPTRARFVTVAEVRPHDAPVAPTEEGLQRFADSVFLLFPHLRNRLIGDDNKPLMGDFWCGRRPVSADGVPIVSQVPAAAPNVWVNAGQGAYGFKLSCGSAQMLAWFMAAKHGVEAPKDGPVNSVAWRSQMMGYQSFLALGRFNLWSMPRGRKQL